MAENYITKQEEKGTINIAEDVIISIVRTAVTEVEGVASLANNKGVAPIANGKGVELAEMVGIKPNNAGIKVHLEGEKIIVDTAVIVQYGTNILSVAEKIQQSVATAVELSSGLENIEANVHVMGIAF